MTKVVFWDVDTQYDFMMESGNLYVPEAESIIPNLEKLTQYARAQGIPILGSVDEHTEEDVEISDEPDFQNTFPPHCMKDTPGQQKINATKPLKPLWIDTRKYGKKELKDVIEVALRGSEMFFTKQKFNVFSNTNVDAALKIIQPEHIVVYGVALDVCNAYAIEGFLKRKQYKIALVADATKPIDPERARQLMERWQAEGVQIVTTEAILGGGWD